MIFSWIAVRSSMASLPPDLEWKALAGGSLLTGIGFIMSLFIANLAFSQRLIDSGKSGIFLASIFSAVAEQALLKWAFRREVWT